MREYHGRRKGKGGLASPLPTIASASAFAVVIGFLLLLLLGPVLIGPTAVAKEIFVGPTGAPTLSEALQLASPGDTITVSAGYDSEAAGERFPIWVGVEGLAIACQEGARIAVPPSRVGLLIQADGVTVEGCEITSQRSADLGDLGILVEGAAEVTLRDNRIYELLGGIRLIGARDGMIEGNLLYDIGLGAIEGERRGIAIHLEGAEGNRLAGNEAYRSGVGLFLVGSRGNVITGGHYHDNAFSGIYLEESYENTLSRVTVRGNGGEGVVLFGADRNVIEESELSGNGRPGLKLVGSSSNEICGNKIHDNGDGRNEDINVLLTGGMVVRFTAPLVPDVEGFAEVDREREELVAKAGELEAKIRELSAELEEVIQKIDTARGMVAQAQVQVTPRRVIFVADGSGSMKGAIDEVQEAVRVSLGLLTAEGCRDKAGIIEFGYGQGGGIKPDQDTGLLCPDDPRLQGAIDRFSADGYTALYDAIIHGVDELCPEPPEQIRAVIALTDGKNNRGTSDPREVIRAANDCGVRVYTIGLGSNIDEDVLMEIADETGGEYEHAPTPEELAAKFARMVGVIGVSRIIDKVEEALDELYCILDGTAPYGRVACPYPAGKLGAIEQVKGAIRAEAEAIKLKLDELVTQGALSSALGEELKEKLEAIIGATLAVDDLLGLIGGLIELVVGEAPDGALREARAYLEAAELAEADSRLGEARLALREALSLEGELLAAAEEIQEKLRLLGEELPPAPALLGENLVGKAEGVLITPAQIAALRAELAARLSADPLAGRAFTPDEISYELIELGGSVGNVLASNVITSAVLSEGPNVGIALEAGSVENTLVNNLITNEDLVGGRRGRFGNLTVGIALLSSNNRILFNAIEFINTAMVRGGPQEREGVKYLYLFEKLALARCQGQGSTCQVPQALAIVGELSEEGLRVSLESAHVVGNKIALNFFERNGLGIDVLDAESNDIEANLFLNNTDDAIRLAARAAVDIKTWGNDFLGNAAALSNNDPEITVNVKDNYFGDPSGPFHEVRNPEGKGDQVIGRANVSPWASSPFCEENFEVETKFNALGIGEFFWGGLPPNLALLPEEVTLPEGKPRRCAEVFAPGPEEGPPPFPDQEAPPQDLDGDGLYEDVNANGRLDFDDAVTLALYIDWVAPEDQGYFDFNGNGRLDFDDAVRLAFRVGGEAAAQALIEMFRVLSVESVTAAYDSASGTIRFVVEGTGIAQIKVEVYSLAGGLVYDSGFVAGRELVWDLLSNEGLPVANGVYLYVVSVRGLAPGLERGDGNARGELRKLVLLR